MDTLLGSVNPLSRIHSLIQTKSSEKESDNHSLKHKEQHAHSGSKKNRMATLN